MDKQSLIKKLAEWAGIRYEVCTLTIAGHCWVYPDGEHTNMPPDFTNSLDACFKWLVPKVYQLLGDKEFFKFLVRWCMEVITDGSEALTLCLAIEKLIDEGVSSET